MILVQYTIRSKQNYIFRTNRLREVTGASEIIRDTFDVLRAAISNAGVMQGMEGIFAMSAVEAAFRNNEVCAVELFCGGGNDTYLFKDMETLRRVNEVYSRTVMTEYPGLIPFCVYVEVEVRKGENGQTYYDYIADYSKLMAKMEREKNRMRPARPACTLPFAMTDRSTFRPITEELAKIGEVTDESAAKFHKFESNPDHDYKNDIGNLEDMLDAEKDNKLAIVHADGNNMGAIIQKKFGENTDYDFCIASMRVFTKEIQEIFSDKGMEAVDKELKLIRNEESSGKEGEKTQDGKTKDVSKEKFGVRYVIKDGDDFTFICNARYALRLTAAYLRSVSANEGYSSCAGICIFKSHYPFSRAYDIAEKECDIAKKKVHGGAIRHECWLDFYYVRGGLTEDPEQERKQTLLEGRIMRPWRVYSETSPDSAYSVDKLARISGLMKGRLARSVLKEFGSMWEQNSDLGREVYNRIGYRSPGFISGMDGLFKTEQGDAALRALYDMYETYDLWFAEDK